MDNRSTRLKELVQELKLYNNPEELEEVKKLVRKNVPLTMRGYLLAYLFVTSSNNAVRNKQPQQHTVPENSTALYVNVGKASRSSARELGEFIIATAELDSADITGIAYKQNYSFVYVAKEKAEAVIEKVNGKSYKGRRIKVNYSKDKDEN